MYRGVCQKQEMLSTMENTSTRQYEMDQRRSYAPPMI